MPPLLQHCKLVINSKECWPYKVNASDLQQLLMMSSAPLWLVAFLFQDLSGNSPFETSLSPTVNKKVENSIKTEINRQWWQKCVCTYERSSTSCIMATPGGARRLNERALTQEREPLCGEKQKGRSQLEKRHRAEWFVRVWDRPEAKRLRWGPRPRQSWRFPSVIQVEYNQSVSPVCDPGSRCVIYCSTWNVFTRCARLRSQTGANDVITSVWTVYKTQIS